MRSSRGRSRGRGRGRRASREIRETSNPTPVAGTVIDEERLLNLINWAMTEAIDRRLPANVDRSTEAEAPAATPVVGERVARGETGVQAPPVVRDRSRPIYGLLNQRPPPEFSGTTDPIEADEWLRSVDTTMRLLQMTDQEKVEYASYLLKGDAGYGEN